MILTIKILPNKQDPIKTAGIAIHTGLHFADVLKCWVHGTSERTMLASAGCDIGSKRIVDKSKQALILLIIEFKSSVTNQLGVQSKLHAA